MIIARVLDSEGVTLIPEIALENFVPNIRLPIAPRLGDVFKYSHDEDARAFEPLNIKIRTAMFEQQLDDGTYVYRTVEDFR